MNAAFIVAVGVLLAGFCVAVLAGRLLLSGYRGPSWRRKNWFAFAGMVIGILVAASPFWF